MSQQRGKALGLCSLQICKKSCMHSGIACMQCLGCNCILKFEALNSSQLHFLFSMCLSFFFFCRHTLTHTHTHSSCKAGLAVQLCIDVICILLLGLLSSFLPFAQSGQIKGVAELMHDLLCIFFFKKLI